MPLTTILLVLVIVAVALYLLNAYVPIPARVIKWVNALVVLLVLAWALWASFGGNLRSWR